MEAVDAYSKPGAETRPPPSSVGREATRGLPGAGRLVVTPGDSVQRRREGQVDGRLGALLADLGAQRRYLKRLLVKNGSRTVLLQAGEIDWIESAGNYVRIHVGSERHLLRETMTALEERLDPERFIRIHRSTIVNLDRVRELEPYFHGDYMVRLNDGTRLTLSRTYRDRLQIRLGLEI